MLDVRGDVAGAEHAYSDALALEPSAAADLESKIEMLRERAELARLPEEYRAIEQSPQITRGDLAALIGVRLAPLLQASRRRDAVLITDVRTHWAAIWIMSVARAGVMDPFSNHAFQPRARCAASISRRRRAASWRESPRRIRRAPPRGSPPA